MPKHFESFCMSISDIHCQDISEKTYYCIIVMIQCVINAQRKICPNTIQQLKKNNMILLTFRQKVLNYIK